MERITEMYVAIAIATMVTVKVGGSDIFVNWN